MSQKTIEIAGIVRNLPDNTVPDGSMQEVINLRPKDGAWRPVGPKVSSIPVPEGIIYIHEINSTTKVYIGYTVASCLGYWVYVNDILVNENNAFIEMAAGQNLQCISLGKILVLINHSGGTREYLSFQSDNTYVNMGQDIEDIPHFAITRVAKTDDDITQTVTASASVIHSAALKIMKEKGNTDKGYATGRILIRFAWELVDGSLVKHTIPVRTDTSVFTMASATSLLWSAYELSIIAITSNADLYNLKDKYKGLISSLNIYTCRLPELKEGIYSTNNFCPLQDDPSVGDEMEYYKVASVPLSDLDGTVFTTGVFSAPFYDMTGRDTMDTDNFTHHTLYSKNVFGYNNRLFLGDVTTHLTPFSSACNLITPDPDGTTGASYDIGFEFDIETAVGKKIVFTGWTAMTYYTALGTPILNLLTFGYPDARASKVRLYARSLGVIYKVKTEPLKPHAALNFAYSEFMSAAGPWTDFPVSSLTSNPISSYQDPNRIQASELNNPFYHPAKNSYRVQGRVLGMSTNAIALSQGQFGQFPVYCFTSEGIWTMNIGNGDVLINTITPLSREVCNNPDIITQIDGGTVFSTSKGLYILQGTQAIEISQASEGNYLSRLSGTLNYEAIANNPNLYQVKEFLCSATILTYLSGAKIAWDHIHKELIISNPTYKYSWVYNMEYKRWFKISQVFDNFVQDFPHTYGYNTISTVYTKYTLSEEDYSDLVAVHMETRPIKLTPVTFKKINRTVIGGFINNNMDFPFSVNLFGSPDKRNWYLLNASNTFGAKSQLLIGRATFSCTYYIVIIGGKVDEEAYFTHVDVDFDETYGNKLR